MPGSDQLVRTQLGAARVLYALLFSAVLLVWLNQQSLSLYCQQRYHQNCELPLLGDQPLWRLGGKLNQALVDARERFFDSLDGQQVAAAPELPAAPPTVELAPNIPVVTVTLDTPGPAPAKPRPVGAAAPAAAPVSAPVVKPSPALPAVQASPQVSLNSADEVFLVGDSMMQGVAPHLSNTLLKRHGIRTTNLSRQSTGLAYPGFFDWPRTVEKTLREHPRIRLMVVFLGPNDPWDMPQGKGKPFLRFRSPAWEQAYRQRIDAVLGHARERGVQVIWVGPPNMRQDRLSTAMAYLGELYRQQAQRYGQHYVSANAVLGYKAGEFSSTVDNGQGGQLRIRADDGIHFTIPGQKLIASQVLALIAFPGPTVTGH